MQEGSVELEVHKAHGDDSFNTKKDEAMQMFVTHVQGKREEGGIVGDRETCREMRQAGRKQTAGQRESQTDVELPIHTSTSQSAFELVASVFLPLPVVLRKTL